MMMAAVNIVSHL